MTQIALLREHEASHRADRNAHRGCGPRIGSYGIDASFFLPSVGQVIHRFLGPLILCASRSDRDVAAWASKPSSSRAFGHGVARRRSVTYSRNFGARRWPEPESKHLWLLPNPAG